jgi:hypothetical protein
LESTLADGVFAGCVTAHMLNYRQFTSFLGSSLMSLTNSLLTFVANVSGFDIMTNDPKQDTTECKLSIMNTTDNENKK